MTTSTENVSFCGVPYLEFTVPAVYANRQKKAERKYTELRIEEKSQSRLKSHQVVLLESLFFPKEVIFFFLQETKYTG